ncbi:MAG TPA: NAD(P)-dependent oxidoreductase, partial [Nitrososphaeraceae archaeon]|nr:NAD(P)-dependent oxidoreductase [Nitrososphaeraceae archaeon]
MKKSGMVVDYQPEINANQLSTIAKDYDVIVVRSRTKITKEIIQASAPSVKIIARVGVGLDNIDINEAEANGIHVINSPEAAANAVSELVIGLMLSLARSIPFADIETKKGNWIKKDLTGVELRGKYLGIIGVGNIGRNIGRIGRSLRMNLIGYDIIPINRDFT